MSTPGSNPLPLPSEHFAQLYRTDAELVEAVATYALDVLQYPGQGMLFLATRRHCDAIRRLLMLRDLDVGGALARRQIAFLHAEVVASRILDGERLDPRAFGEVVGSVVATMLDEGSLRHLHVFGEVVDVLRRTGNRRAGLGLEDLWTDLGRRQAFTLYCAYMEDLVAEHALDGALDEALAKHSALMHEVALDGARQRRVFVEVAAMASSAQSTQGAVPRLSPLVG